MLRSHQPCGFAERLRIGRVGSAASIVRWLRCLLSCLAGGLDVLVHPEEVRRVVPLLRLREAGIVVSVRRPYSIKSLVSHEVDIRPLGREGMDGVPCLRHPRPEAVDGRGIWIGSEDRFGPPGLAI